MFFFRAPASSKISTLSLHDALPISWIPRITLPLGPMMSPILSGRIWMVMIRGAYLDIEPKRSEEHTSELQSRGHLVCRLLLEKKKPARGDLHSHRREYRDARGVQDP